jgi:hypothetical protein
VVSGAVRFAAGSPGSVQGAASTALPLGVPARDALAADSKLARDGGPVHPAGGERVSRLEAAALPAREVAMCGWNGSIERENGPACPRLGRPCGIRLKAVPPGFQPITISS